MLTNNRLYRGCKLDGKWEYGHLLSHGDDVFILPHRVKDSALQEYVYHMARKVDTNTVGQCTGAADSEGRCIYEGDILSCGETHGGLDDEEDVLYKVFYDDDSASFLAEPFQKYDDRAPLLGFEEFCKPLNDLRRQPTIVGNIHDNKDLLFSESE